MSIRLAYLGDSLLCIWENKNLRRSESNSPNLLSRYNNDGKMLYRKTASTP